MGGIELRLSARRGSRGYRIADDPKHQYAQSAYEEFGFQTQADS